MWLFSETGFVSAVQDRDNSDGFVVRGRDRKSLQPLADFADVRIIDNEGTDYPFRVYVEKSTFSLWVSDQVDNVSYTNYKGHMHKTRGWQFCDALHDVWSAMHSVTPKVKIQRSILKSGY